LKQILGALIFGAGRVLSLAEMRRALVEVAETQGAAGAGFAKVKESDLRQALDLLNADLTGRKTGFHLAEVAGGYRLQTDVAAGPWLRHLLEIRPSRLSRPALETLAIIAYRQPVTRSEIEAVRGVNVDHIVRNLLEMQLIRITGRSNLPGRPMLYGTTQLFLDHFGLKDVKDLPGVEQLCRIEADLDNKTRGAHRGTPEAEGETNEEESQEDTE
jgi:segregation and condensation protein B